MSPLCIPPPPFLGHRKADSSSTTQSIASLAREVATHSVVFRVALLYSGPRKWTLVRVILTTLSTKYMKTLAVQI
jgi:hypothetical protein